MDLPADLRTALDAAVGGTPVADLAPAVERLIARYRSGEPAPAAAILTSDLDVLAYAAYRMPATYAAVRAVLTQVAQAVRGLSPVSLVDVGGGTGAAAWAATDALPSLTSVLVLDRVPAALRLGERLATGRRALAQAGWRHWLAGEPPPAADLVTVSYLLGELAEPDRAALLAAAARSAHAVVVVEPGTPPGYGRVLAARQELLDAGMRVVAPCPHQLPCPLTAAPARSGREAGDWCHFGVRVNRSTVHRRAKGATLGYEDEKYSYVAAVRELAGAAEPKASRVLRRPVQRSGVVTLRLCTPSGTAVDELVSKRQGARYRAARDTSWGDTFE